MDWSKKIDLCSSDKEIKNVIREYEKKIISDLNSRYSKMKYLLPNNLNSSSLILDYGCGWGVQAKMFFDIFNCQIDAIDHSNEILKKAKIAYGEIKKINFQSSNDFKFPSNNYDLIYSCAVIEHVHNPGNYLYRVNKMNKKFGYLLIGLPNISNINYLLNTLFLSKRRVDKLSKNILKNYHKPSHHINGWDPTTFITLLASCGYETLKFFPMEGTPIFSYLYKIPIIGKYLYHLKFTTNLSYTMFFLAKKVKNIDIKNYD